MGAYLSEPVTDKFSVDNKTESLRYGASSMQGWRVSQEDAHNCIVDFDENTSLFAVYDGHGGAEVAQYCAFNLPPFIKATKAYKEGNIAQALEDAFLAFDSTLVQEDVLKELKEMAGINEEPVEEEENEIDHLHEEAHMPLEELLAKYRSALGCSAPNLRHLRGGDKPQSPCLRAKKPAESSSSNDDLKAGSSSSSSKEVVTQSSGDGCEREAAVAVADNSNDVTQQPDKKPTAEDIQADCVASSTDATKPAAVAKAGSAKAADDDVSISSSSAVKLSPVKTEPPVVNGDVSVTCSKSSAASSEDVISESGAVDESAAVRTNGDDNKAEVCTTTPELIGKGKAKGKGKGKSLVPNSVVKMMDGGGGKKVSSPGVKTPIRKGKHRQARPLSMEDGSEGSETEDDTDEEYEGVVSEEEDGDDEDNTVEEEEEEEEEDDDDDEEEEEEEEEQGEEDDSDTFTPPEKEEPGYDSGCTAVVTLLCGDELYVANAGDSRCVVCRAGQAIEMSHDHKPEDEVELRRIVNAGGKVTSDGRVNGGLNLSRAIGDHSYKKNENLPGKDQMISALPDIRTLTIDPAEDEFMVVACDGIWNFMSSQDVVNFVRERITAKADKLSSICEELFNHCLSPTTIGDGTGCDNMTCIVVKFDKLRKKAVGKRSASEMKPEQEEELVSSSKKSKSEESSTTTD